MLGPLHWPQRRLRRHEKLRRFRARPSRVRENGYHHRERRRRSQAHPGPQIIMPLTSIPGFADPFSSLSHLLGAAIFLALGVFLIRRGAGNAARVASLVVFVIGSVLLLSISGTYHLLDHSGAARRVLRVLDHCAIF